MSLKSSTILGGRCSLGGDSLSLMEILVAEMRWKMVGVANPQFTRTETGGLCLLAFLSPGSAYGPSMIPPTPGPARESRGTTLTVLLASHRQRDDPLSPSVSSPLSNEMLHSSQAPGRGAPSYRHGQKCSTQEQGCIAFFFFSYSRDNSALTLAVSCISARIITNIPKITSDYPDICYRCTRETRPILVFHNN